MTRVARLAGFALAALLLLAAAPRDPAQPVAVIPFDLVDGHIFVDARAGDAALRMVLDTGAGNVLAADTAARLGVRASGSYDVYGAGDGAVKARSAVVPALEVGGIVLRDQHVTVMPFDGLRAAEGVARFDGLIGHELFDAYDVRIDYAARSLALYAPGAAPRDPGALSVPLGFDDAIPEVSGDVDGMAGSFTIDTGDRGSFTLTTPFIKKFGLLARYQPRVDAIAGWGIGGPVRAKLVRVGHLRFGGVDVPAPVTRLPDTTSGFFTSRSIAGNIGYGVLHRFTVTFDYRDRRMFLTPGADDGADVYDRSGLWLVAESGGFRVADVVAGSPAAGAGVRAGDVIDTIDGRDVAALSLADERAALRGAPGTQVALRVRRGETTLDLTFRLADLV